MVVLVITSSDQPVVHHPMPSVQYNAAITTTALVAATQQILGRQDNAISAKRFNAYSVADNGCNGNSLSNRLHQIL